MTQIPFPIRSNPGKHRFQGEPRLVNVFPEEIGAENRNPIAFNAVPGQVTFADDAEIACRGMIAVEELGIVYTVHGSTVYEMEDDGSQTALDGVLPGSKPVVMERGPERFMSSEVTITIASPGVVSWNNHNLPAGTEIQFSTDGELPTGFVANTTYFVLASGLTANSFSLGATDGGAAINTSVGQSGTHTAIRVDATYQVAIVSDLATFILEDGNLYLVDPDDELIVGVTVLAQRFVYFFSSGRYGWSPLNDGRTIEGYATAEARPDGLVGGLANLGEMWLLGKKTVEIHRATGDAEAPFAPLGGAFIDKGCASRDSALTFDNAVCWVTNENNVVRGAGYRAEIFSEPAQDRAIAAVSDKTTIRGYVDTAEGHSFYVLTCADWTWAYDAKTKVWHERKSYQRNDWRAWPYCVSWGYRLVGDKASGEIRKLDNDLHTEDGIAIRCELILPDVPGTMEHDALELDVATGVGLNVLSTANGYDPQIMLSWSDDGGYTYGNERTRSIGRQGEYGKEVKFTRLGTARTMRGRRYKVACSEPTIKSFMLVDLDAKPVA